MDSLKPGTVVAEKYRVERAIGLGGMGAVYLATHIDLEVPVALKVLASTVVNNPEAVSRFFREAKASACINGEHVARVIDVGRLDGETPFMVMEYLDGCDLGTLLETEGPLSVEDATEYILQAADAVAQAHALGIVHRDLKPRNLFLTKRTDGTPLVKVLDFGVSKAEVLGSPTFGTTHEGAFLGSPSYMAPEQIQNAKSVSAQADIWSLGVILYELLTGHTPFEADSVPGVLVAISISPPTPITEHRRDLPVHVVEAIERCLSKDPAERPEDVGELVALLTSKGRPSLQTRAGRVTTTLRAVAEHHASSSKRAAPPASGTTLPSRDDARIVSTKRRRVQGKPKWAWPAPRMLAGVLAGVAAGAVASVVALTRAPVGTTAALPHAEPSLLSASIVAATAVATEEPANVEATASNAPATAAPVPSQTLAVTRAPVIPKPVIPRVTAVTGSARAFGERAAAASGPFSPGPKKLGTEASATAQRMRLADCAARKADPRCLR